MDYILVIITRVLAICSMIITLFCISVRIKNKFTNKRRIIYSGFIFIPLLLISIIYSVLVIMCDFVNHSVESSTIGQIVLYFTMCGMTNLIITIFMFVVATKNIEFQNKSIKISKALFFKKNIMISDIDIKKSEYIFDNKKSIFKKSVLTNHDEYVILITNDNIKKKIGLNVFLYSMHKIDPFKFFVFELKIKRRESK